MTGIATQHMRPGAEEWAQDEAACADEQAHMEEQDELRRHELANGALYEWACDDDFGWQLLSRDELAGHRRFYERLRPFNGSADEATHHLNVLSTCGGGDGDDGDDSDGGGGELEEDVDVTMRSASGSDNSNCKLRSRVLGSTSSITCERTSWRVSFAS